MRIALCQMNILFEKKDENLARAREFIAEAARQKADMILFPEMSFTGFSMKITLTGEKNHYTADLISKEALRHSIHIGFGWVQLKDGKGENHYTIVDKNGDTVSDYIKLHSFAIGGERGDFRCGETLPPVFTAYEHDIASFICYDLRFPEIFRAISDDTSAVIVAANWPEARREHWLTLLRARAIENQVYIIGVNCVGKQGDIAYSGDSRVIAPDGRIIAQAEQGKEELLICSISNDTADERVHFPVRASRRTELYKKILKEGC